MQGFAGPEPARAVTSLPDAWRHRIGRYSWVWDVVRCLLKTTCSPPGFAGERARAPIPHLGRFIGRLTAVSWSLPFGVGWADGPVKHLVAMSGQ